MQTIVPVLNRCLFILPLLLLLVSCHHRKAAPYPVKHSLEVDLSYDSTKKNQQIADFFQHLHSKAGFNGAVLVAKKGKIVYKGAFGYANYLKRIPLTTNSRFQLASISKQFTAVAAMILKDRGKLRFEQTVTDFFPAFPYPGVSLRMLLTHRSGLPNYQYFSESVWKDKQRAMTNADLIDLLVKNKPGRWGAPDGRFEYNNINYAVLAAVIEKVSGQHLADFMKSNVFDVIGMNQTHIYNKAVDTLEPTNLIGYVRSFKRKEDPNWLDGVVGDKGVYTTVSDMFIWDQMLYTDRIVMASTLKEAFVGYSKEEHGHFNYGYGWRIFDVDSTHKIVYHTGWWHGYKNIFVRDIKNEVAVVILSNMFNSSINNLDQLYAMLNMPAIRKSAY